MSNQQHPGGQPNPWSSQDPNWKPTQFTDRSRRDPTVPFGQEPAAAAPPPPQVEPPRRSGAALWLILGLGALVLMGAFLLQTFSPNSPEAPASESAVGPRLSALPSAAATGRSIPFEGNGNGTFSIVDHRWNGNQLTLQVRVTVDEGGEQTFTMFAFNDRMRTSYDPVSGPLQFTASLEQPYEGEVVFELPAEDSTIVLGTRTGAIALNGLAIPGP